MTLLHIFTFVTIDLRRYAVMALLDFFLCYQRFTVRLDSNDITIFSPFVTIDLPHGCSNGITMLRSVYRIDQDGWLRLVRGRVG